MDAIVGYHLNPLTCGVAKFNAELARRLRVPFIPLGLGVRFYRHPLFSIKISEFAPEDRDALQGHLDHAAWAQGFSVFLHGWTETALEHQLVMQAKYVYTGNQAITRAIEAVYQPEECQPMTLWCPPLLTPYREEAPGAIRVLTFGMAHKLRIAHHQHFKTLLDALKRPYTVRLSTALHDGMAFEDVSTIRELQHVYGDSLRWLGVLSDQGMHEELLHCMYCALFFDPAARANNSTVQSAMAAGAVVVTNLDEDSPEAWIHHRNLLDLARVTTLPTDLLALSCLSARAAATAVHEFSWALLERQIYAG